MFSAHLRQPPPPFHPHELMVLQRVFDRECAREGIAKSTPEAESVAATLLHLFRSGIDDEELLEQMILKIGLL